MSYRMIKHISRSNFDIIEFAESGEEKKPLLSSMWLSDSFRFQGFMCLAINYTSIFRSIIAFGNYGYPMFVPFVVLRVILAVPLCLIQLMLGKFMKGNISRCWSMCAFGKGVFYCFLVSSGYTAITNQVCIMYMVKYLVPLILGLVPWSTCDPSWADSKCYEAANFKSAFTKCLAGNPKNFCDSIEWESSSLQYYKRVAANPFNWYTCGFNVGVLIVLSLFLLLITRKGIITVQKSFKLLIIFPITLAFIFAISSFTTRGSSLGFIKTLEGNIRSLGDVALWTSALKNCLINYGLNTLSISFLASNENFEDDMIHDLIVVVFSEVFSCIFLTLPIFTNIELIRMTNFNLRRGLVVFLGSEDVFVLMMEALLLYPPPMILWGGIFLLMMIFFSIGTQAVLILSMCDATLNCCNGCLSFFPNLSITISIVSVTSIGFIFLPHNFDFPLSTVSVIVIFLSSATLTFFYGVPRIMDDFHFMMGYIPSVLMQSSIYLSIFTMGSFLFYRLYFKPSNPIVYVGAVVLLSIYVLSAIFEIFRAINRGDIMKAFKADPDWGPTHPLIKKSRLLFNAKAITKEFMYRQELKRKHNQNRFDFTKQEVIQLITPN